MFKANVIVKIIGTSFNNWVLVFALKNFLVNGFLNLKLFAYGIP